MSMNLHCQVTHADGRVEPVQLWQTPTVVTWGLVGGRGDFGSYYGTQMLLKYSQWVLGPVMGRQPGGHFREDVEDLEIRIAHLQDLLTKLMPVEADGGLIEWFVL